MPIDLRPAWLAATLLLGFAVCGASAAGLPLAKNVLAVTNARIEFTLAYPRTGNLAIDAALSAFAHRQLEAFRGYGKDARAGNSAFSSETTYTVARNDGKMFGVVFREDSFTGGAHPNDFTYTFNFLLPDGAQVFLPEILDGQRGLKRVSQLAAADLIANISGGSEPLSDPETITEGTSPSADHFKAFIWLPSTLHLYFPSYQVAAYAAGPQEATIPLAKLREVIRPDWRAPAPSFDCAKALSGIEKAVCADAALARLDRQVAETYQTVIRNAYEPKAQEAVRQTQRAWLARRNTSCAGPAPGPCLTKLYQGRLATLSKAGE